MLNIFPTKIPIELSGQISSLNEERANMISHGLGLLFYIILTPFMLVSAYKSANNPYFYGTLIFCISLLMVYLSSTWYHGCFSKNKREKLRILDHICIYFLIAGTYTPFVLTHFQDTLGTRILIVLWSMAAVGTIFKLFFINRFNFLSTMAYLVMGWQVIFIIGPITERLPSMAMTAIIVGGISYSIGVIFYLWENLRYNHLIWHIFVLIGSTSHLFAVANCLH